MLLDKTLAKPNLIQETGVMLVRDVDGRPWRSERECAHLLERKLITGLIGRGAGLVQWLWHTNSYMDNDNENSIGLVRADGSAKPELEAMLEFGRLMQAFATAIDRAGERTRSLAGRPLLAMVSTPRPDPRSHPARDSCPGL